MIHHHKQAIPFISQQTFSRLSRCSNIQSTVSLLARAKYRRGVEQQRMLSTLAHHDRSTTTNKSFHSFLTKHSVDSLTAQMSSRPSRCLLARVQYRRVEQHHMVGTLAYHDGAGATNLSCHSFLSNNNTEV
jgi:hypothetical protein